MFPHGHKIPGSAILHVALNNKQIITIVQKILNVNKLAERRVILEEMGGKSNKLNIG